MSALHLAVDICSGDEDRLAETVESLLKHHANVNAANHKVGRTSSDLVVTYCCLLLHSFWSHVC